MNRCDTFTKTDSLPRQVTIDGEEFTLRCLTEKHVPELYGMIEPLNWDVTLGDVQRAFAHNTGHMFGLFNKEDVMSSEL